MPVYEYRCEACGSVFEARRAVTERDRDATCPQGHARSRRRLPLVAAVRGTGPRGGGPAAVPQVSGGCGPGCACVN